MVVTRRNVTAVVVVRRTQPYLSTRKGAAAVTCDGEAAGRTGLEGTTQSSLLDMRNTQHLTKSSISGGHHHLLRLLRGSREPYQSLF